MQAHYRDGESRVCCIHNVPVLNHQQEFSFAFSSTVPRRDGCELKPKVATSIFDPHPPFSSPSFLFSINRKPTTNKDVNLALGKIGNNRQFNLLSSGNHFMQRLCNYCRKIWMEFRVDRMISETNKYHKMRKSFANIDG